ncbi:ATP synthase F1 subunit epsilon [Desulfonema ishimotonii]|uniref:ATP synthase epsilon chain n=1 Tax=Desulfonema ishimotonii TaxID=45657 RepID=A0A401G4H1_9BACT|nr:F0F1 ATP synthase subunit epsilon [Desulfonema ishimotonii]GBC64083.1 ATP synthase F1 subunit epsilon [Desulfonema ishimotonii]
MAEMIKLEVVTPEKYVVSENVQIVVAPGILGEFGVLSGHTPFMSALKVGAIRYTDESGAERVVFVSGGFAEALPDKVTVLAESAERRRDIDVERAKSAFARAQKRVEDARAKDDIDFARARASLERALHRVKLAGSR